MVTIYFALAGICTVLWLPILFRFYRAWVSRHNPVSLAICAAILLLIWMAVAGSWIVTGSISACTGMLVSTGISSVVALYAHLAFYWSKKRFTDERKEG